MTIIGIDLGTTNSLVAVWKNGKSELIPNSLNSYLTPSVIGLGDQEQIIVGQAAKDRTTLYPEKAISFFKRYMGSKKEIKLGKHIFHPEEASALVLKSLKEDAESFLGESVEEAVISVPAYFNDSQRKATKNAAILAGLKVNRLVNEPTAACVAYGLIDNEDSTIMVLDLGGGTFDVTIMEKTDNIMEVHASSGDNFLGGEDFNNSIFKEILKTYQIHENDLSSNQVNLLYREIEKAKIVLSSKTESLITLQFENEKYEYHLSRSKFESICSDLIRRLRKPVERAIKDSGLSNSDLDAVVLVGGSTRMPVVRSLVSKMFGVIPTSHLNPDEVVCLGVAIQAGMKERNEDLKELILTDVCPYTLGTEIVRVSEGNEIMGGYFLPVIERNTVVPASREEIIATVHENQTLLQIEVYQGESRRVVNNVKLGSLKIALPKGKAGEEKVNLRYTYDINGLLEVEATVLSNGQKKTIILEDNPGTLTAQQIKEKLKKLESIKFHPREEMENVAFLARAERVFEEEISGRRLIVGNLIDQFEDALKSQNKKIIDTMRAKLADELDQFEMEEI